MALGDKKTRCKIIITFVNYIRGTNNTILYKCNIKD